MPMPDLTQYTDEEFEQLAQAVLVEQENRRARAAIPGQIETLRAKFVEVGGDPADLEQPAAL